MDNKKVDIEELIADARAEEEVARSMKESGATIWAQPDFRDELRDKLKETFTPREEESVRIALKEYVTLINKAMDLDRVLSAIVDCFKLSYNNEYLTIHNENRIAETFRALYPDAYDSLYVAELDRLKEYDALINGEKKKEA